jgi:glutaredoxin
MEWSHPERSCNAMLARNSIAALSIVVLAALAGGTAAQSLYRYIDANGRVVYSDQPPPPTARDVQPKRLPENVIETDPLPFAMKQAAERFPVTLYTFDCDVCRDAQALLVKRGIPFATVIVTEEKGAARLKALTGKQSAPVLQVGDKQVMQGYNEDRWQAMLDEAGYPRGAPPSAAQTARTMPAPAAAKAAIAVPTTPEPDAAAPAPGHDYPK